MNLLKSKVSCISLLFILFISNPLNAQSSSVSNKDSSGIDNRITVVENPMYGATLAWKTPHVFPSRTEDKLGLIESGARVRILREAEGNGVIKLVTQVEILEGRLKGQVGWVSSAMIRIR